MDKQPLSKFRLLHFIHSGDLITFHWCMCRKRQRQLTGLSKFISHSADGFYYVLIPPFILLFDATMAQFALIALATAFCIERPLYCLLKKGLKRNRPADTLPDFNSFITPSDQFSFPSGHTSGAFLCATVVATLIPELFWPAYLWACLIGASRILLGVHFPTDTLAGALIGSTVATLTMEFLI
ncbi:MAG: phosphatase PAP2 family protein [Porticoccaceae bacterium]|nr:phosphatase PAP2 family protein [Porticoccaceae bacterium]